MRMPLPTKRPGGRDLLTAHREQLLEWAENYPPTFADKHALVSAEIARLEGRAFDAMQWYKQAIPHRLVYKTQFLGGLSERRG